MEDRFVDESFYPNIETIEDNYSKLKDVWRSFSCL